MAFRNSERDDDHGDTATYEKTDVLAVAILAMVDPILDIEQRRLDAEVTIRGREFERAKEDLRKLVENRRGC